MPCPVTLLLLGMVGQVVALRVLVVQLARSPDDPRLIRREGAHADRAFRHARHRWLTRAAIAGFVASTGVAGLGVALLVLG